MSSDRPAAGRLQVAAVVLAAGRGRRFGGGNKLMVPFQGRPLVCAAVDAALQSRAEPVVVVSGSTSDALKTALSGLSVSWVVNPDPDRGLSSSLRLGLAALPADLAGAAVLLADMPLVTAAQLDRLIDAFEAHAGRAVCVPVHGSRRGNPVVWPADAFPRLAAITGDRGGRALFADFADALLEVEMKDDAVLIDVDDADALARAERAAAGTRLT